MRLDVLEYHQNEGLPNSWQIERCEFGDINLIVGKNASGKTRILNRIVLLANLLAGDDLKGFASKIYWKLIFDSTNIKEQKVYILEIDRLKIIREEFTIGTKTYLQRNQKSEGTIWAKELAKDMKFQTPFNQIAASNRRDLIQHPFLEDLYEWADSLRFYQFGTDLGKGSVDTFSGRIEELKEFINDKDADFVVEIFRIGQEELGDKFTNAIKSDMYSIGYDISDVGTQALHDESMKSARLLYVQESDLQAKTEQFMMSQGMFRALSLIIQVNYSLLAGKPSCILIDDIGEGLDFERSSELIKILIEKAKSGAVQIIMTTNDRFVMNGVPLEYWSVIDRQAGLVKLHNIQNSKDIFEQFKFTGLNNFDFFSTGFYATGFSDQEEAVLES